jgi:hypothetical protein
MSRYNKTLAELMSNALHGADENARSQPPPVSIDTRTRNQRARDEIAENDARLAAERAEQQRKWQRERERAQPAAPSISHADVELIVAQALAAERAAVLPLLADITAEALETARERQQAALRERASGLELQIAKLLNAVNALETALSIERSRVLDRRCLAVN